MSLSGSRVGEWLSIKEQRSTFCTEHFRCVDSLGLLLRNRTITDEMHDDAVGGIASRGGCAVWHVAATRGDPLRGVKKSFTVSTVIESFRHKGLQELFEKGSSARIQKALADRALRRLDAIDAAKSPEALNLPGFDFHGSQGKPKRYSVHVNGPWCITFEWQGESALKVDLENYY